MEKKYSHSFMPYIIGFAFFAYVMNPSLKFLYKSAVINFIPAILCFFILIVLALNNKIFITKTKVLYLSLFSIFFCFQYISFIPSSENIETFFRVVSIHLAFVFGLLIGEHCNKDIIIKLMIAWCILLCVGQYVGLVNYSDGIEYNHLNFTLPLATLLTWLLFSFFLKNNDFLWFRLALIIFIFFNILFAGSRTAIIFPFITCLILIFTFRKFLSKKKFFIFSAIFTGAIIFTIPFILEHLSSYFISKVENMSDISNDGRYDLYTQCLHVILNNPFGLGYGGYQNYILEPYPHNILLEIALNSGLISAFIFIFLVIIILRYAKQKIIINFNEFYLFSMVLLCYSLVSWMLSNDFASSGVVFFLLGIMSNVSFSSTQQKI